LPRSDRVEREIDGSPVQVRLGIFPEARWKLAEQPEEDGLKDILGILLTAGHAIRGSVNQFIMLAKNVIKFLLR
jgi:hypothetical protein